MKNEQAFVWDDLQVFLALARKGTLTAAATELQTSIATLSRRISRLEEALQQPLFTRHQTGYRLSEDGQNLLSRAEAMEEKALSIQSEHLNINAHVSGPIRLATAENFASQIIVPNLAPFLEKHPQVSIELATQINSVNLHRRDADMAIRMVRPERGHLTFRQLGTLGYGLYGQKHLVDQLRHSETLTLNSGRSALIGWDSAFSHLETAQWISQKLGRERPILTASSLQTQRQAILSGLGIGLVPHMLVADDNVQCLQSVPEVEQTIYLVIHSDLIQAPRIRIFSDYLAELFHKNRARLASVPY